MFGKLITICKVNIERIDYIFIICLSNFLGVVDDLTIVHELSE